jgi:hypothetical protein
MRAMAGWEAGVKQFKTPVGCSSNLKIQSSAQIRKLRYPRCTDFMSRFCLICLPFRLCDYRCREPTCRLLIVQSWCVFLFHNVEMQGRVHSYIHRFVYLMLEFIMICQIPTQLSANETNTINKYQLRCVHILATAGGQLDLATRWTYRQLQLSPADQLLAPSWVRYVAHTFGPHGTHVSDHWRCRLVTNRLCQTRGCAYHGWRSGWDIWSRFWQAALNVSWD